jgi:hypothetical protein
VQRLRPAHPATDNDPANDDDNDNATAAMSGGAALFGWTLLPGGHRCLPGESGRVPSVGHRLLRGTGLLRQRHSGSDRVWLPRRLPARQLAAASHLPAKRIAADDLGYGSI